MQTQKNPWLQWTGVVTAAIPDLDHFKCYKTDRKPVNMIVGLADQFGPEPQVKVAKPRLFCNPVAKRHDGQVTEIADPMAHLTCYQIDGHGDKWDVRTVNQFGFQTLEVKNSELLCVPSLKMSFITKGEHPE